MFVGVYRIANWAHLTNAHAVVGDKIIGGLKEAAEKFQKDAANDETSEESYNTARGLLLLAQMSSAGNLCDDKYTQVCCRFLCMSCSKYSFF